jgi:teichuronic acid biosynthesis glycosyltransferase TuaH
MAANRFRASRLPRTMSSRATRPSFLVLAANTPWVYALAQSLEHYGPVTAVRMIDWSNNRRLKPQWPETESGVRRVALTMPQGYAGTLEPLFRPFMRRFVDHQRTKLRETSGTEPVVICPYPFIAPWVRHIPSECLVYYNLDDYALYNPGRVDRNRALEDEMIRHAALSICLSQYQVAALQRRIPECARKVRHFPLGVVEGFINPEPDKLPVGHTVGYVGNMTDRVDWGLVRRVAQLMPDTSFHFVGDMSDGSAGAGFERGSEWLQQRKLVFAMPNVLHEGPVQQRDVPLHYWKYAVNWMPYDVRHPFNIASCPTKIMDALASGRPFVSTDIPEARIYPGRVHVVSNPEDAASKLLGLLSSIQSHDARGQIEYSRTQAWPHRARQFLDLLN